jgi:sugar/nucleoside kinase (ribokinase family)
LIFFPLQTDGRTLNGSVLSIAGGVGRNIADAIGRLRTSHPPFFVSTVGGDDWGKSLMQSLEHVVST